MGPRGKSATRKQPIKIHDDFTEGNIILVGNDEIGFKLPDFFLKARSPVFLNVLDTVQSDDNEIKIPDADSVVLQMFVSGLMERPIPRLNQTWASARAALNLCQVYECPSVARCILGVAIATMVTPDNFFPALVAAAECSDVLSAHFILLKGNFAGYLTEATGHLIPRIVATYEYGLKSPLVWTREEAEQFPRLWYWALINAAGKSLPCYDPAQIRQSSQYWREVAHHFLESIKGQ